ncbi:MAG TPA: restriction endonuclease subunit S [Chitinophagales bacterium]|nr:restriction endonuclease subunit S [Chitinophagales bacterium]
MELSKTKYKQTEIGLIPEDWEVLKLKKTLVENPKYGIGAAAIDFNFTFPTYLRITDIEDDGKLRKNNLKSVDHKDSDNYFLKEGDIVFARTGASVGKSYLYDIKDGFLVYAGFLIKVSPDIAILNSQFLKAFVTTKTYWNWVTVMSMRSGQPGINSNEFGNLKIPLPPLPEQKAIAEVLSDTDQLLQVLEQKLTKKRAIKQGAMQTLLTPKEDWEVKKLGEIGEGIIGLTYSPNDVSKSGTLVLRSSNVQNGQLSFKDNVFVEMNLPERVLVKENDILICVRNGSKRLIGKCAIINKQTEGSAFGAFMTIYRSIFSKYIFYVFQSHHIQSQIDEVMGATINQITNKDLNSFEIPFPSREEQTRIATILSDMDAEIEQLEQKLSKYKMVKQGLMQNLLTGKIRLV